MQRCQTWFLTTCKVIKSCTSSSLFSSASTKESVSFQQFIPWHVKMREPFDMTQKKPILNLEPVYKFSFSHFETNLLVLLKNARHKEAANFIRNILNDVIVTDEEAIMDLKDFLIMKLEDDISLNHTENYLDILIYLINDTYCRESKKALFNIFRTCLDKMLLNSRNLPDKIDNVDSLLKRNEDSLLMRQYLYSNISLRALKINHFHAFRSLDLSLLSEEAAVKSINVLLKNNYFSIAIDIAMNCKEINRKTIVNLYSKLLNDAGKNNQYLLNSKLKSFELWMKTNEYISNQEMHIPPNYDDWNDIQ